MPVSCSNCSHPQAPPKRASHRKRGCKLCASASTATRSRRAAEQRRWPLGTLAARSAAPLAPAAGAPRTQRPSQPWCVGDGAACASSSAHEGRTFGRFRARRSGERSAALRNLATTAHAAGSQQHHRSDRVIGRCALSADGARTRGEQEARPLGSCTLLCRGEARGQREQRGLGNGSSQQLPRTGQGERGCSLSDGERAEMPSENRIQALREGGQQRHAPGTARCPPTAPCAVPSGPSAACPPRPPTQHPRHLPPHPRPACRQSQQQEKSRTASRRYSPARATSPAQM